jgi:hypothetical protein
MERIDHNKAYLLGLLVGSGKLDTNTFILDLPFKKWGLDPKRMSFIAVDILTRISNLFKSSYNLNVTYEIGNDKWLILPIDDADISLLKSDLQYLGLPTGGFLLSSADLSLAKSELKGVTTASFLSGIFDARASLTLSHRRFTNEAPTVSIEIPGSTRNFKFVVQLCSWLTDLGSITDQILFNHPNQHSASDPYYKGWKKGFKIRILIRSFLTQYSFALQAKSIDITEIEKHQKKNEQVPCILRKLRTPSSVSVHSDQNSKDLPVEVRNKLFFHYHHFCKVLGCPHAPTDEVNKMVSSAKKYINFFPRLSKGVQADLAGKFLDIQQKYFSDLELTIHEMTVYGLLENPIFKRFVSIEQGIAYLFADVLNGKRHIGDMQAIINGSRNNNITITTIGDGFDSPLLVTNVANQRAFICSSVDNVLNQHLTEQNIIINDVNVNIKK